MLVIGKQALSRRSLWREDGG